MKAAVGLAVDLPVIRRPRPLHARDRILQLRKQRAGLEGHRLMDRFLLKQGAQMAQQPNVLRRRRKHIGAGLRNDGHQAFVFQLHESGAHRRLADAERLGDLHFRKVLAKLESAGDDGVPNPLERFSRQ